jgi:hypothetical protein
MGRHARYYDGSRLNQSTLKRTFMAFRYVQSSRLTLLVGIPFLLQQTQAQEKPQIYYPDVAPKHWAAAAIEHLSEAGLIEGLPDGTFAGSREITRNEFVVALARMTTRMPQYSNWDANSDRLASIRPFRAKLALPLPEP